MLPTQIPLMRGHRNSLILTMSLTVTTLSHLTVKTAVQIGRCEQLQLLTLTLPSAIGIRRRVGPMSVRPSTSSRRRWASTATHVLFVESGSTSASV